jgi:hypothetical protein
VEGRTTQTPPMDFERVKGCMHTEMLLGTMLMLKLSRKNHERMVSNNSRKHSAAQTQTQALT